ncbi:MAG: hypothetical protein RL172_771, partial [Bacteroidota bacterium]
VSSTWAQAKFTAYISPGTIGKDETAELKLLVENAATVQKIIPPSLQQFIIISGPNQETGMETIAGITRQYTGLTYILKPKEKGEFVIAAATAVADGITIKSNPLKLKVINGAAGNGPATPNNGFMNFDEAAKRSSFNDFIIRKGDNIADKISKNIFVKVYADKTSCYVGEPLVVTYKLYTRLKSESNIVKNPSFNGFSVIDMLRTANISSLVETLDGREYNVYTLRKAQLYPLQAGEVQLEAASVENEINFIKEAYVQQHPNDFLSDFGGMALPAEAFVTQKVTLQSKPLSIYVKPLPEKGRPASFSGAVGNFTMQASASQPQLTTDDAGRLVLQLQGEGNLLLINAPEINWPKAIEVFEPGTREEVEKRTVPVSGRKTFFYNFVIGDTGRYTLPAIEFSYFDTHIAAYKTLLTQPINLTVTKGTGKPPVLAKGFIQPIKTSKEKFFEVLFTKRWLLIAPLVALMLTGLFIWVKIDKNKKQLLQTSMPQALNEGDDDIVEKEAKLPLAASRALLQTDSGDARQFYATLDKELKTFLAQRLQLAPQTIQLKEIAAGIALQNFGEDDKKAIVQLLDEIALQLYTPFADESRVPYFYKKAEAVVHLFQPPPTQA